MSRSVNITVGNNTVSNTYSGDWLPRIVPFTVNVDPSIMLDGIANTYQCGYISYDWGDGSAIETVFRAPSAAPQDQTVSHTYYRPLSSSSSTFTLGITAVEMVSFATLTAVAISIPTLELPTLSAWDGFDLLGTRSIGTSQDVLMLIERVGAGRELFPVMVSSPQVSATTTRSASCADPSTWPTSLTVSTTAATVTGTSPAASALEATFTFITEQGQNADGYYSTIASSILGVSADWYLFGGGGNYPEGQVGTLAANWAAYSIPIASEMVLPALGEPELLGTALADTVLNQPVVAGDIWKYLDASTSLSAVSADVWYTSAYSDATWPSGSAVFGYGEAASAIETATSGPTAFNVACSVTFPVTAQYFRKTFSVAAGDVVSPANALRIRFRRDDGIVVYLNDQELFRDNMPAGQIDQYTAATCPISGSEETRYNTFYFPLSTLNVGDNLIAAEVHVVSGDTQNDLTFDLEASVVETTASYLPTTYGQPHVEYFNYLPNNGRYYSKDLGGDTELFVLNSGRQFKVGSCNDIVEPDGIGVGSDQFNWFVNAITNSSAKWKVVMFYHPYVGSARPDFLMPEMDWGFGAYGVNLVLNGGILANEHLYKDGVHIVNMGVGTRDAIAFESSPSRYSEWRDTSLPNGKSDVCFAKVVSTPFKMTVSVIRASTGAVLRSFDIV